MLRTREEQICRYSIGQMQNQTGRMLQTSARLAANATRSHEMSCQFRQGGQVNRLDIFCGKI